MIYSMSFILLLFVFLVGNEIHGNFRSKRKSQRSSQLKNSSFVFYTLSFEIRNNQTIQMQIQLSPKRKEMKTISILNGEKYFIESIEIEEHYVIIYFNERQIYLTIEHEEK